MDTDAYALTCLWLPDDRCGATAIGMAAHPVEGVIPICKYHADMTHAPLIGATSEKDH